MSILNHQVAIYKYFEIISSIPRGSKNEKAISDYLVVFAKNHQLQYVQDDIGNVIIYKAGTKGYENHPTVMLQGHMDMVCEKNKDVEFDFEHDPLQLYIDEGWLKAKGTTLGADDGYAVSYMLAILESEHYAHPPLECVFTVQEEIGLIGVKNLKAEYFQAKKLIGMDSGGENKTTISCSGGRRNCITKSMILIPSHFNTFQFSIKGLLGGHSGHFISKERGNAIKIMSRFLKQLSHETTIYLVSMDGGLKENAIPRECDVIFAADISLKWLEHLIQKIYQNIYEEFQYSDQGLTYHVSQITRAKTTCDAITSQELIDLLYILPCGMHHHSMVIPGLTTCSNNIGVVSLKDDHLEIFSTIRSPMTSLREYIAEQFYLIASLYHATSQDRADYPGWNYEGESPLRELYKQVIREKLGKELLTNASHGGIEVGVLKGLLPELDIITLGPISENAHTPDERMNLASFEKMFDVLVDLLSKL